MPRAKPARVRVVFDTNLWVSMTMGGKIACLATLLAGSLLENYVCPELISEVTEVLQRRKLQRFLKPSNVEITLDLLESGTTHVEISQLVTRSRDAADDYLLALAQEFKLDFLVTGDKDLLVLGTHHQTEILTFADFLNRL